MNQNRADRRRVGHFLLAMARVLGDALFAA
jgi:hypothetical protein